jgi:hypothetical protein
MNSNAAQSPLSALSAYFSGKPNSGPEDPVSIEPQNEKADPVETFPEGKTVPGGRKFLFL